MLFSYKLILNFSTSDLNEYYFLLSKSLTLYHGAIHQPDTDQLKSQVDRYGSTCLLHVVDKGIDQYDDIDKRNRN